jgi:hypothetical protein
MPNKLLTPQVSLRLPGSARPCIAAEGGVLDRLSQKRCGKLRAGGGWESLNVDAAKPRSEIRRERSPPQADAGCLGLSREPGTFIWQEGDGGIRAGGLKDGVDGTCWLQERRLGDLVLGPGNGVICGMPGERKAGGSTIPPQTAFVKKAFRAELKGDSIK